MRRRELLRRALRARRRMTSEQRQAYDLIVFDGLTLPEALQRTGLSEEAFLKLWSAAFRLHIAEVEAKHPWWRCW